MPSRRALRLVAVFLAVGLLGVAFAATPGPARADANAPRWSAGDFWIYADSSNPNTTLRIDVVAREPVQTLLSNTYDAFHLRHTTSAGPVSLTTDSWVRDSDLGIVRTSFTTILGITTIFSFDPPQAQASFPLSSLKSWTVSLQVSIKVGGGNVLTVSTSASAQVEGEADIVVPAGTFHSFSIRPLGSGGYTKVYYSEQVGYWSKQESYNAQDQKTGEMVLTGYHYQWNTTFLLIIGLVVALIAVIAVAVLLRMRKRSAGPPGGQPPQWASPPQPPQG
ncbi:MAG: hypothetical protein E6K13_01615 [Methanobacteriota archaeon]|nr:MAG: hypothetical protein E6K13_01615 [Euryarchaeota archaeon]